MFSNTVFVYDGNYYVYRYTVKLSNLTLDGVPIGGCFQLFRKLLNYYLTDKEHHTESLFSGSKKAITIVVFDGGTSTYRRKFHQVYKYKYQKDSEISEAVYYNIKLVKELLSLVGIPVFSVRGFEGDDLIYLLCRQLSLLKFPLREVSVFTRDSDLLQVLLIPTIEPDCPVFSYSVIDELRNRKYSSQRKEDISLAVKTLLKKVFSGDKSDKVEATGLARKVDLKEVETNCLTYLLKGKFYCLAKLLFSLGFGESSAFKVLRNYRLVSLESYYLFSSSLKLSKISKRFLNLTLNTKQTVLSSIEKNREELRLRLKELKFDSILRKLEVEGLL